MPPQYPQDNFTIFPGHAQVRPGGNGHRVRADTGKGHTNGAALALAGGLAAGEAATAVKGQGLAAGFLFDLAAILVDRAIGGVGAPDHAIRARLVGHAAAQVAALGEDLLVALVLQRARAQRGPGAPLGVYLAAKPLVRGNEHGLADVAHRGLGVPAFGLHFAEQRLHLAVLVGQVDLEVTHGVTYTLRSMLPRGPRPV